MANILTDLAADIYKSAEVVGRELTGAISSMTINSVEGEAVALNDTVRSFTTQEPTLNTTYAPSMTIPEGNDQTVGNKTLVVSRVANVRIPFSGEDVKHLDNGAGYDNVLQKQLQRAFRKITNTIEGFACETIAKGASRSVGTAGTTPFASNFNIVAEGRQILVDNGTPMDGEVSMILDTAAGTKLRNLAQLQKANEAGGDDMLRRGTLLDLQGVMLKETGSAYAHTKGTGASYVTNGTFAVGETVIDIDGGSGTVLAGDIVTFQNDTNAYVVSEALAGGAITLAAPGLRKSLADGLTVTLSANRTGNFIFHRAAAELVVRPPAQPKGGDAAADRMTVQDPFSGLVYEIAFYKGYNKNMIDITTLYGAKVWNDELVASVAG